VDLWEAFGEWSAYRVGIPLLLNSIDGIVLLVKNMQQ
jgi:hypothetical protein